MLARVGRDRSISCGQGLCTPVEVRSPPLQGREGLLQIYQAMEALSVLKPNVNRTTGLHVHVSLCLESLVSAWIYQEVSMHY